MHLSLLTESKIVLDPLSTKSYKLARPKIDFEAVEIADKE